MTTDQEEQAEKRRVMLQDADVRNRSRNGDTGTFLSHTHIDDAGGRFSAVNAAKNRWRQLRIFSDGNTIRLSVLETTLTFTSAFLANALWLPARSTRSQIDYAAGAATAIRSTWIDLGSERCGLGGCFRLLEAAQGACGALPCSERSQ